MMDVPVEVGRDRLPDLFLDSLVEMHLDPTKPILRVVRDRPGSVLNQESYSPKALDLDLGFDCNEIDSSIRNFRREFCCDTDLHLAGSRNQLQALRKSLDCNSLISSASDLKGISSVKSTAPTDLPCGSGRTKTLTNFDLYPNTFSWKIQEGPEASKPNEHSIDCGMDPNRIKPQACYEGSSSLSGRKLHRILMITALVATLTFMAALHPPSQLKEARLNLLLFISFNTLAYFASTAMTIILLQEYPFKPWPTLSVLALLGSYLCLVTTILPLNVILLLSSLAMFATAWICRLCLCSPVQISCCVGVST